MSADLYIFWDDKINAESDSVLISASDVVGGYAIDYARQPDLFRAWKGGDSTTADKWLQIDGVSTTFLGSAGATAFATLAYDARGSDQDTIKLVYDTADSSSMSSPSTLATWTLNKSQVVCEYKSFTIPTVASGAHAGGPPQYYRLTQYGNERSETTGSITAKILHWGIYGASDVLRLSVNYPDDAEGAYAISQVFRVAGARTAGGMTYYNKWAQPGQRFTVSFSPASDTFWRVGIRDRLRGLGGPTRAFFILKNGLYNPIQSNVWMCRLTQLEVRSRQNYFDQFDIDMEFETEPWL